MSPTSTQLPGATTPIRRLAKRDLATVGPDATLREVAEELAMDEIGAVLVRYGHDPIGVISERDLVAVIANGGHLGAQATDLMTVELVTVPDDTSVLDVARVMLDAGIRHVLVREEDEDHPDGGAVAGIVSIRDVVGVLLGDDAPA